MQKTSLTKILFIIVIVIVASYGLISFEKKQQNKTVISLLKNEVEEQSAVLIKVSNLTRANTSDELTSKVVVDCSADDRKKFEGLLDKLSSTITLAELTSLDSLFYKCGSFNADQKSMMAVSLVREVGIFNNMISLKNEFDEKTDEESNKIKSWQTLAELELQSAQYFNSLVDIQGQIISLLISGKRSDSEEVKSVLAEASSEKGKIIVLNKQIETLRQEELHI